VARPAHAASAPLDLGRPECRSCLEGAVTWRDTCDAMRPSHLVVGLAVVAAVGTLALGAQPARLAKPRAVADERCPATRAPESRPAARILRLTRANAARFVQRSSLPHFRVSALFALGREHYAPGLRRRRYLEIARNACGETIARRSWVVVISMPAAPAANFGLLALFFARTDEGWRAWYGWLASAPWDRDGFFPGD
jgi:hypothetical protein